MKAPHIIMVTISNKAMMKVFCGEILLTANEAFEANVRGEMFPIFSEFASCGKFLIYTMDIWSQDKVCLLFHHHRNAEVDWYYSVI